jgi:ribonuclease PH
MVSVIRPDCRSALELRAFSSEVGLISEADGSARCRMGETNVVVAVYGPAQAR